MPGFGALISVIGLGAVAFLVVNGDQGHPLYSISEYLNRRDDYVDPSVYYYP